MTGPGTWASSVPRPFRRSQPLDARVDLTGTDRYQPATPRTSSASRALD